MQNRLAWAFAILCTSGLIYATGLNAQPNNAMFRTVQPDTLKKYFALTDTQITEYKKAVKKRDTDFRPIEKLPPREQIPKRTVVKDKFIANVRDLMDSAQFSIWMEYWKAYNNGITPLQVYNRYVLENVEIPKQYATIVERFDARYGLQATYSAQLAEAIGNDSLSAMELLINEIIKNDYIKKPEVRRMRLKQPEAYAYARAIYDRERNEQLVRKADYPPYMKRVRLYDVQEQYLAAYKAAMGEDKYREYIDFQDNAFERNLRTNHGFSDKQIKQYLAILKDFDLETLRINRAEIGPDEKQKRRATARTMRDKRIRAILTPAQSKKFFKTEQQQLDQTDAENEDIYEE